MNMNSKGNLSIILTAMSVYLILVHLCFRILKGLNGKNRNDEANTFFTNFHNFVKRIYEP